MKNFKKTLKKHVTIELSTQYANNDFEKKFERKKIKFAKRE